jgi:hypothetical protein
LTEDRGEVALSNIIYLFDARSAKVGAVDGTSLAGSNCRDDLKETVESQGTASRLNACESLGDAELVVIRSTAGPVEHSVTRQATTTYSARQTPFLTVG